MSPLLGLLHFISGFILWQPESLIEEVDLPLTTAGNLRTLILYPADIYFLH
jgi:hypothetical protein